MNETNTANNPLVVKFELPQVVNETLTPLATAIGDTLATGWKGLTIGIDTWYGKKQIEHDINLVEYRNSIQTGLSSIPQENLQEPKMSILGPSLEASKYYFEEEQYREMFSKLIASTCDNRKNKHIHSCFVEIIKQMDPKDAILLKEFINNKTQPVVEYNVKTPNGYRTYLTNVYLSENESHELTYYSPSLVNLERLGLVKINLVNYLYDIEIYKRYENHPEYLSSKEYFKNVNDPSLGENPNLYITKGFAYLTSLGEDFIKVCVQ